MQKNVMLIDGNSLGNMSNAIKPLRIGDQPVQAIYGFFRTLREIVSLHLHYIPMVLWDGHSWRQDHYPEYKANRRLEETPAQIKMQAQRAMYKQQRPHIRSGLRLLGVPQISASNMEADDLAAILTDHYRSIDKKVILVSGDSDWLQLVDEGVSMKDLHKQKMIRINDFREIVGLDNPRQLIEMKALAGECGDNIKGVGGIGQKGAVEFLNTYGSYQDFTNRVIFDKDVDLNGLPAKFRALAEDEDKAIKFRANMALIDLRSTTRPKPKDLKVDKGIPNEARFREFCELLLFKSFLTNFDNWISVFPSFRKLSAGDV